MEKADKFLLGMAGSIVAYDLLNKEKTISSRVAEYREHTPGKMAVLGSIAMLGLHLSGAIPAKYDPLSILFERSTSF